jgi:hypothetical protein
MDGKTMSSAPSPHILLYMSNVTHEQNHTTGGIPRWLPTLVLVARFSAYVRQSGRDAQFSLTYGRMYTFFDNDKYRVCNHRLCDACKGYP